MEDSFDELRGELDRMRVAWKVGLARGVEPMSRGAVRQGVALLAVTKWQPLAWAVMLPTNYKAGHFIYSDLSEAEAKAKEIAAAEDLAEPLVVVPLFAVPLCPTE